MRLTAVDRKFFLQGRSFMFKYLTYLVFASIAFTGAINASSCPRCDEVRANNLKNKNEYVYYEDYLKANGEKVEEEKTDKDVQKKMDKQKAK
jgi:hypothetical protein